MGSIAQAGRQALTFWPLLVNMLGNLGGSDGRRKEELGSLLCSNDNQLQIDLQAKRKVSSLIHNY